jgi:hypothetical protein
LEPGTTLGFLIFFEGSTKYQMLPANFQKMFRSKKPMSLDRYKYPKNNFFEFFSTISLGLSIGTKGKILSHNFNILQIFIIDLQYRY